AVPDQREDKETKMLYGEKRAVIAYEREAPAPKHESSKNQTHVWFSPLPLNERNLFFGFLPFNLMQLSIFLLTCALPSGRGPVVARFFGHAR
ncbi:hypothetical protein, partial [Alicyclobacillus fodiniaquatilis]